MKEIFRSKDITALLLKKQFLAENDVPSRILLDGTDITEFPLNPRYGAVYHLDREAILVVDDEDEQAAYDFLDNIEIPVGEDEPIRNRFGQTGEDVQKAYKTVLHVMAWILILLLIGGIVYVVLMT